MSRKIYIDADRRKKQISSLKEEQMRRYQERVEAYNAHPNTCLTCEKPLFKRENETLAEAKKRKYCNSSCFAIYSNKTTIKRKKSIKKCKDCGKGFPYNKSQRCPDCVKTWRQRLSVKTKAQVKRSEISSHAFFVIKGRPKVCSKCGYNKFVEICHIKAVKDFSPAATVAEINAPDNLMYLCPNCHWEFDHNL